VTTAYMPFVAIVGGFWDLEKSDPSKFAAAKKFASELGAELAKNGVGLVVYNSDERSLEPHVVSGYSSAVPPGTGKGSIRVRCARSQRDTVRFAEEKTRSDLFADPNYFPGDEWEAPFYRSLVAADGVDGAVLMAGERTTLVAGQIAIARPLPLLAIDHFGGAAEICWKELATTITDYPINARRPADLVPWLKSKCGARATERESARQRESAYARGNSETRKSLWAAGAFIVLLVTLLIGIGPMASAQYYTSITISGLIAAGATGALIRSVFWGAEQTAPAASLLLGAAAGIVVGLAYLIPQWVGAPGVLSTTAPTVQPADKIQFVSALLVAVTAGVGFDTVFTRLRKEAETEPVTPQSQK